MDCRKAALRTWPADGARCDVHSGSLLCPPHRRFATGFAELLATAVLVTHIRWLWLSVLVRIAIYSNLKIAMKR
jgi:hypothetical protein